MPPPSKEGGVGGKDAGGIGSGPFHCLGHVLEHWQVQVSLAGLLWVRSTDNLCSILESFLSMESSLVASEALENKLGVGVDAKVVDCCDLGRCRRGVGAAGNLTCECPPEPICRESLCIVNGWGRR